MAMPIDFNSAVNAYRQAAKSVESSMSTKSVSPMGGGEDPNSFVGMVNDSLKSAVQTGREAEELSLKQISGEADLKDVVTAVANAEHTLQTVVAVRDKVLNAYQEILRMPI
jgi:flagellar hook-basal body complex protein FliE